MRVLVRVIGIAFGLFVLAIAAYAGNAAVGMHASARTNGTLEARGLHRPLTIVRDERGVAHIRAADEHDAFFGQGYAQGSDRLFQIDLLRRYVYGRLSEVLGGVTVDADFAARTVPVQTLVDAQWNRLTPRERDVLVAFSEGVNAAMASQPTPIEFRLLLYSPEPWTPKDSMAVGFATVLDLTDTWNDIGGRSGGEPLTDPCYDAPVLAGLRAVNLHPHCAANVAMMLDRREPVGSNEWASGAAHTTTGRALLANDPHLRLGIPGVWYLDDIAAPGFHVAGATLAGTPGVTLGHNDDVAWGATNGTVAALSVYEAPAHLDPAHIQTETIHVRFGRSVTHAYYRTRDAFAADIGSGSSRRRVLVSWDAYRHPFSPLPAFFGLNRAHSLEAAVAALRTYPGPTQNFVLADRSGRAAYYLAGHVPHDPLWARGVHDAGEMTPFADIAFDALPHVAPSRDAIVWTANNKMYDAAYPLRLSAEFSPPYRAYRIASLLRARERYDVSYFATMQMDTISIPERELARRLLASRQIDERERRELEGWDGSFAPSSQAASLVFNVRRALQQTQPKMVAILIDARNNAPSVAPSPDAVGVPWSTYGAVTVKHSLAALGFGFLNGTRFEGNGDAFTVHVQNTGFSQSFRAVWDVGNWDAGGITIPQGESGQPGSPHYNDESAAWTGGKLLPLPYSEAAVRASSKETLTLHP